MGNEPTQHLTGGDLVRYLDGEGSAERRAAHQAHLAACARCAADLDVLRAESRRVSGWLRRSDAAAGRTPDPAAAPAAPASLVAPADATAVAIPVVAAGADSRGSADADPGSPGVRPLPAARPASRRWSGVPGWLKAAAAVLLVTAPAVAVPGVREWVVERVTGPRAETAAAPAADPEATAGALRLIRFVPTPGPFTVRVDAAEEAGTLTLGRSPSSAAAADPAAGGAAAEGEAVLEVEGGVEPVVSASALRLRNGGVGGSGRYVLRVPPATSGVRVLVAGREVWVDGEGLDRGVVVGLGG